MNNVAKRYTDMTIKLIRLHAHLAVLEASQVQFRSSRTEDIIRQVNKNIHETETSLKELAALLDE